MITNTKFIPTKATLGFGQTEGHCYADIYKGFVQNLRIEINLIGGMRIDDIMNIITHEALHWVILNMHRIRVLDNDEYIVDELLDDHEPRVRILDSEY